MVIYSLVSAYFYYLLRCEMQWSVGVTSQLIVTTCHEVRGHSVPSPQCWPADCCIWPENPPAFRFWT